ncbi:MAG: PEP-CTERM sorting domain-containing protein [Chloroflexi bacterium]|nr:PEP-CTERM sorting domain-containing protein [Chloroflexota bacterium]
MKRLLSSSLLAVIVCYQGSVSRGSTSFFDPEGGWIYTLTGDSAFGLPAPGGVALDGTWSNDNGSDEWDGLGRGLGNGQPGGVESAGGILTIEDAVNISPGFEPSNRKLYFTHDVSQEGMANNAFIDEGLTLHLRARLTPRSDELATPNGYGIFDGGKGNFGVRQAGPTGGTSEGLISFSLVQATEDFDEFETIDFGQGGLTMNRLNGDVTTSRVNSDFESDEGTMNLLPLDPTEFHEFWITIKANDETPGNGTHTVTIYLDGDLEPKGVFDVTAGSGDEGSAFANYLALGAGNTTAVGGLDVDFFSYKPGVIAPVPEPSTLALFGLGGLAILFLRRRS